VLSIVLNVKTATSLKAEDVLHAQDHLQDVKAVRVIVAPLVYQAST
jgi:hypothetical protein